MLRPVILSASEQVAVHLRGELLNGTWSGLMPGGDKLAAELGIGRDTVEAALKQVEKEGLLVNQGRRRGRSIAVPNDRRGVKRLRLCVLLDEDANRRLDYVVAFEHELAQAGPAVFGAPPTLADLVAHLAASSDGAPLARRLERWATGSLAHLFAGGTALPLDRRLVVIGLA